MSLGPQFEQLKMLMTGTEIKNRVEDSYDRNPLYSTSPYHDSYGDPIPLQDAGGGDAIETMDEMWDRKLTESKQPQYTTHGAGVYDSIKEHGFTRGASPITINMDSAKGVVLNDGHHRVASAAALDKEGHENYIPVTHREGYV
jgi:hypothetical protein